MFKWKFGGYTYGVHTSAQPDKRAHSLPLCHRGQFLHQSLMVPPRPLLNSVEGFLRTVSTTGLGAQARLRLGPLPTDTARVWL